MCVFSLRGVYQLHACSGCGVLPAELHEGFDNHRDELVLQDLMSSYYHKGNRPQVIVSPFFMKVYYVHGRSETGDLLIFFPHICFLTEGHLLKIHTLTFLCCFLGKHIIQITHLCLT